MRYQRKDPNVYEPRVVQKKHGGEVLDPSHEAKVQPSRNKKSVES